ncbi:GspH/FimT family pseudopilin [Lysobacter tyrosinilyticus]
MKQLGEGMQGTNRGFTLFEQSATFIVAKSRRALAGFSSGKTFSAGNAGSRGANCHRSLRGRSGFTLVELLITVAIMAILVTLATPALTALINGNRLRAAANETIAIFQSARFEAIRANRRTVVCMSADPNAAVPACGAAGATGWIAFVDADRNGQYAAAEPLLRRATVASGVKLLGSAAFGSGITFNSDGMARDVGGNLLTAVVGVCLPTTKPQENESDVSISSGSRILLSRKAAAGKCLTPGDKP